MVEVQLTYFIFVITMYNVSNLIVVAILRIISLIIAMHNNKLHIINCQLEQTTIVSQVQQLYDHYDASVLYQSKNLGITAPIIDVVIL